MKSILICTLLLLGAIVAESWQSYQVSIPNGDKVMRNGVSNPGVGHTASNGGGVRNIFGAAFAAAGNTWTTTLCNADTDGDGQSNGFELGDPNCVWSSGKTPSRTTDISHPAYADSMSTATTTTAAPPTTTPAPTPAPPTPVGQTSTAAPPTTTTTTTVAPTTTTTTVAATPAPPTSFSNSGFNVFAGFMGISWSIIPATGTTRRATSDQMDITFNFTAGTTEQWGGIGFSTSGMAGPLVICYVDASAVGACDDWTGSSNSASPRSGSTTVVSASVNGNQRFVTARINLAEVGVSASSLRTIFAYGTQVGTTHIPHSSGSTQSKNVDFYTGTTSEIKKTKAGSTISMIVGVVVTILLTAVGGILNFLGFTPSPMVVKVLWVFTFVIYLGLFAFIIIMSHDDYVKSASTAPIGRAFGDVTAFAFFLVLWPTMKHIGPAKVMGIAYERFLIPHITLGILIYIFMTIHFGIVYNDYAKTDAAGAREFIFSWKANPRPNIAGFLSWLFLSLMIIPALFLRRKFFSFFKFTHLMFLLVIVMGALHHWPLWILVAPSFLVYIIDVIIRMVSWSAAGPSVNGVIYHEKAGVTELQLVVKSFSLKPSQYVFLTFDPLGGWAHPFSVASYNPDTNIVKFFIKNMGAGTFTDRLAQVAKSDPKSVSNPMWLGPYGNLQVPLTMPNHVILCCGGIGVTPMMSTLAYIGQEVSQQNLKNLKSVTFVWSIPSEDILNVLALDLGQQIAVIANSGLKINVDIYVTRGTSNLSSNWFNLHCGKRPQWNQYFSPYNGGKAEDVCAGYVCGPAVMMDDVSAAATGNGCYLHTETFEF